MTIKVMVWNAQHMDNQSTATHSEAFREKLDFLDKYLAMQKDIDVIAFLETGKTGNVNQSLEDALLKTKTTYVPISHLAQEGGSKKNTTLGISVYVRSAMTTEFSVASFEYVLNHKERRAPVTIKHKGSQKYFSFYHANANEKTSRGFIKEAIEYIRDRVGEDLALFAGDMNFDYYKMDDELESLYKLGPTGAGYTHSKFQTVKTRRLVMDMARRYEGVVNNNGLKTHFNRTYGVKLESQKAFLKRIKTGEILSDKEAAQLESLTQYIEKIDSAFSIAEAQYDRQYTVYQDVIPKESVVVTNRFLDYAFVDNPAHWSAICHGSVSVIDILGVVIRKRLCADLPMRSDHFPVIYSYG